MTPRTNEQVLLSFYERVQPFGFWSTTARKARDRPRAPVEAFRQRAQAIIATALSLFLLLFGIGRLMVSPPDANVLWTWVAIVAGLALIPLWWRALAQEDLEVIARSGRRTSRSPTARCSRSRRACCWRCGSSAST